MKERSPAHLPDRVEPSEAVGRARRDGAKVSEGQRWTLEIPDEAIADRLLSLGIAGVGGFVDGGRFEGRVWLLRKLAERSLADRLRERRGAWPPAEAIAIGLSIARSLAACERQSLFPGPITTETIAVEGTAAALHAEGFVRSLVGAGSAALHAEISPRYTPPEQASGAVWDSAANRYVLGLILYRLLGGEHPFAGAGLRHALEEAARHEPPPFVESVARDLPAGLQSYVIRMLAPDASLRPASAQAIVDALAGFLRGDLAAAPKRDGQRTDRKSPIPVIARHPERSRAREEAPEKPRPAASAALRFWPLAAGVMIALGALSLLAPPAEKPRITAVLNTTEPLRQDSTSSQDCAKCHSRQTSEWRRSVMAHVVKSLLFNGLEMLIEEQVGRSFECPNGAGALRRADPRTACRVSATGQTFTGAGGEHWCISCHSPAENLENRMPAWDARAGGDAATRRPPRDILGDRAMEPADRELGVARGLIDPPEVAHHARHARAERSVRDGAVAARRRLAPVGADVLAALVAHREGVAVGAARREGRDVGGRHRVSRRGDVDGARVARGDRRVGAAAREEGEHRREGERRRPRRRACEGVLAHRGSTRWMLRGPRAVSPRR